MLCFGAPSFGARPADCSSWLASSIPAWPLAPTCRYEGCIAGYSPKDGSHFIEYDDGDQQHHILGEVRWLDRV